MTAAWSADPSVRRVRRRTRRRAVHHELGASDVWGCELRRAGGGVGGWLVDGWRWWMVGGVGGDVLRGVGPGKGCYREFHAFFKHVTANGNVEEGIP